MNKRLIMLFLFIGFFATSPLISSEDEATELITGRVTLEHLEVEDEEVEREVALKIIGKVAKELMGTLTQVKKQRQASKIVKVGKNIKCIYSVDISVRPIEIKNECYLFVNSFGEVNYGDEKVFPEAEEEN